MITVRRGPEPAKLAAVRGARLLALRALARQPESGDIDGYRIVAEDLWKVQHFKCCYCEARVPMGFNDVEHYRPKASANRSPGSPLTHGYWWLAFTWENLLFACPSCNRSAKNNFFPLEIGSVPLNAEDPGPGAEVPLLIDPASATNPVEHIEFVQRAAGPVGSPMQWWARPRNGSRLGWYTIDVCKLNNYEFLELRGAYYQTILRPQIEALRRLLNPNFDSERFSFEFNRSMSLLQPNNCYVCLAYDAFCAEVPNDSLRVYTDARWPAPSEVGV